MEGKWNIISCKTTMALSFKNGKASIIFIISPGDRWTVSKNKKSNLIFNFSKNLWGCSPVNNCQLFANSGKYSFTVWPVSLDRFA